MAHLIADALLEHSGSGNQAFEQAQEAEVLPVSITSAYDKLGNLPLAVSETLLEAELYPHLLIDRSTHSN